jgi:antitoxin component of RelBE/YafQ-DinJ toxin-antitoxin module
MMSKDSVERTVYKVPKVKTSVSLSQEVVVTARALADELGLSISALVEMSIRELARSRKQ